MTDLRTRPLRATVLDAPLYVQRSADMAALTSAVRHGFNVLVVGPRGSGKSSLVHFLERDLTQTGIAARFVSAGRFTTVAEILCAVAASLGDDDGGLPASSDRDPLASAYSHLARAAADAEVRPIILLDGIVPTLARELFGRLRDELWTLELQWVVTADTDSAAIVLTPPADAFFEQVITLTPFTANEIGELLTRRDNSNELDHPVRLLIIKRAGGNPARALALARQALMAPDPMSALERGSIIDRIEHALGEPAARLADDLVRNGPGGPSDAELLARLGWSRPRAYQVFKALEDEGFVEPAAERTGTAGRPRITYRLTGLP